MLARAIPTAAMLRRLRAIAASVPEAARFDAETTPFEASSFVGIYPSWVVLQHRWGKLIEQAMA